MQQGRSAIASRQGGQTAADRPGRAQGDQLQWLHAGACPLDKTQEQLHAQALGCHRHLGKQQSGTIKNAGCVPLFCRLEGSKRQNSGTQIPFPSCTHPSCQPSPNDSRSAGTARAGKDDMP